MSPIDDLAAKLADSGVTKKALVSALYVLRAPRSLAGIALAASHFSELKLEHEGLRECPEIADYASRLQILDLLADKCRDDPVYGGQALGSNPDQLLRPFCGDSVICDALLLRHRQETGIAREQFERVVGWFTWQAIRFQVEHLSESQYASYLDSSTDFLIEGAGQVLYAAWLALRKLGRASESSRLADFIQLDLTLDAEVSRRNSLLFRMAVLQKPQLLSRLGTLAQHRFGLDEKAIGAHLKKMEGVVTAEVARFLCDTWKLEGRVRAEPLERLLRRFGGRTTVPSELKRYGDLLEATLPLAVDDLHSGLVSEYFLPSDVLGAPGSEDDEDEDDALGADGLGEPVISLFLSDRKSHLEGYYAARGLQTAIEYANAGLPWSRSRLSSEAVEAVKGRVTATESKSAREHWARQGIGLSLLCGRPLEQTCRPLIAVGTPPVSSSHPIGISLSDMCVVIHAGAPTLKAEPKLTTRCDKHESLLRMPLPQEWEGLVKICGSHKAPDAKAVQKRARQILRELPEHFGITEAGLRRCLSHELLRESNGDSGLLKAVTDAHDINLQNIIHYSSYPNDIAEEVWRQAAQALVGSLRSLETPRTGRVGAVHGFNLESVRQHIADVRARFLKHQAEGDWPRAYTYLTLYTIYWVSLACASRRTKSPVPSMVIAGEWAYRDDKHLQGGYTDRLDPLSAAVRAQLDAWVAFADNLSLTHPTLLPFHSAERGQVILLQFALGSGVATPFRPKVIEDELKVACLPANWARKIVRSEGMRLGLSGRAIDAGCGHWSRGRNVWRNTSTMATKEFQAQWLEFQGKLESELGFKVLAVPGLESPRRRPVIQLPAAEAPKAEPEKPDPAPPLKAINELMRAADPVLYDEVLLCGVDTPPVAAMELVRRTLRRLKGYQPEQIAAVAEQACEVIREKLKIPLFAVRPRPQFQRDWLLDSKGMQTLAWCEDRLLPKFRADLTRLPEAVESAEVDDIELGRLAMLAIWRIKIVRRPLLLAFLAWLSSSQPILATGDLRYITLRLPSKRGREWMSRTVYLDEFCCTYLLVERSRLRRILKAEYSKAIDSARRSAVVQKGLKAYVRSMGIVEDTPTLSMMMDAGAQDILLNSSPLLAGYARGEFVTHDLGDVELRRLAGLEPHRKSLVKQFSARSRASRSEPQADSDISRDPMVAVNHHLPPDLKRQDVVHLLSSRSSRFTVQMVKDIRAVRIHSDAEKLVQNFALWSLEAATKGAREVNRKAKNKWRNNVLIVGHSLLGMLGMDEETRQIDGETLDRLQELGGMHFSERTASHAWQQFREFVCKEGSDLAGFTFTNVSADNRSSVSARILRADSIADIRKQLESVLSGVGAGDQARAHLVFWLASEIGARRAELAWLRSVEDFQGNLLRLQAYGIHRLKTDWSERVAPWDFLTEALRSILEEIKAASLRSPAETTADPGVLSDKVFSAINRVIQQVTGDASVGLHHLRHTVASQLLLSTMRKACRLDTVVAQFPWVRALLVEDARLGVLFGSEQQMGQGLQVISALLGHSHPITTLRHYIHTVGIAFYSATRSHAPINALRTFENRLRLSTVQRWAAEIREGAIVSLESAEGILWANASLQRRVEARLEFRSMLDIDDRLAGGKGRSPSSVPQVKQVPDGPARALYLRFDDLDRRIRVGELTGADPWLAVAVRGFQKLHAIRSGKRGDHSSRHPLDFLDNGCFVPTRLAPGSARFAVDVIQWSEVLREDHVDDFDWLMRKWALASDRRGRMHLDGEAEAVRAERLASTECVSVRLDKKPDQKTLKGRRRGNMPKAKATRSAIAVQRMRIDRHGAGGSAQDAPAVRWVMSWLTAIRLGAELTEQE